MLKFNTSTEIAAATLKLYSQQRKLIINLRFPKKILAGSLYFNLKTAKNYNLVICISNSVCKSIYLADSTDVELGRSGITRQEYIIL